MEGSSEMPKKPSKEQKIIQFLTGCLAPVYDAAFPISGYRSDTKHLWRAIVRSKYNTCQRALH
jgi:hypothetical protein